MREHSADFFTTPEWVKHAVFYQIFPERFCNGNSSNDPENAQPWGTTPTWDNYMGGDLEGIIKRLDYLADLGINAIYLNPIFHAFSNHKYNTYDYFRIDPHFGDMETFRTLIKQAHRRGIRVILDGVFNHCGRGFFAFQSILEQGTHSPYLRWFRIIQFPLNPYDHTKPANYMCWWNIASLPKFNTDHDRVRRYLLDVARYWIEQGIDGWRLDVPNEIADHEFWREFRRVVKRGNPDAYIVGEIWKDASPWLDGTQFDAVMNYLFRDLCRDFFAQSKIGVEEFAHGITDLLRRYPREVTMAQLNLLGSHDTARFRTEANGNVQRVYVATLFQMTFPGAPCIYYGDEIGMQGGQDPLCRGCFPWDDNGWDMNLHDWTRHCITVRHAHPALQTGQYQTIITNPDANVYGFARWNDTERIIVLINASDTSYEYDVPLWDLPFATPGSVTDAISHTHYPVQDAMAHQVNLPAWRGVVLICDQPPPKPRPGSGRGRKRASTPRSRSEQADNVNESGFWIYE